MHFICSEFGYRVNPSRIQFCYRLEYKFPEVHSRMWNFQGIGVDYKVADIYDVDVECAVGIVSVSVAVGRCAKFVFDFLKFVQ